MDLRGLPQSAGYLKDGKTRVYHCSAGKPSVSSCTLFFIELPTGIIQIVAIGEHADSTSYRLSWHRHRTQCRIKRAADAG